MSFPNEIIKFDFNLNKNCEFTSIQLTTVSVLFRLIFCFYCKCFVDVVKQTESQSKEKKTKVNYNREIERKKGIENKSPK